MPKEKSINPAQAQRKAEKAKAIKKGKAEVVSRRNEKLARRNPDRLQKQLDELKAIETSGGKLTTHEKTVLEGLEREVKAVRKARETLGDAAPKLGGGFGGRREDGERRGAGGAEVLGKRRRADGASSDEEEDEVPEDVKRIPMPRDTPPPIPKEVLDRWYQKRRERMGLPGRNQHGAPAGRGTNANMTPLGDNERRVGHPDGRPAGAATIAPPAVAKTTYEAAPVIRDLRKEAVSFVPAAVRAKLNQAKGVGGLVEPEDMDRLERAGYVAAGSKRAEGGMEGETEVGDKADGRGDREGQVGTRGVMMEEVSDEDG